jgi:hypothetical protein
LLFWSSASRAVAASRMTESVSTAMSGLTLASPSPITTMRRCGGSAACPVTGTSIDAATRAAMNILVIKSSFNTD